MLIICIYCALLCLSSPLSKPPPSLQSRRSIERNTANMTWLGTIQSDMTQGDEENTYGFLTIPATYPNAYYIPALAVPDRKAKRYLGSCIHRQHQRSIWNAVSLQIDLYLVSVYTTHSPAFTSNSASRGQQGVSPEPCTLHKDLGMQVREPSSWHLLH